MATDAPKVWSKTDLVRRFVDFRKRRQQLEDELKQVKEWEKEAELELFDAMETDEEKTINHALGRLTRVVMTKATVTDEVQLFQALEERGLMETHTKRAIRQAVMNDFVKAVERNEEEALPGVEPLLIRQVRYTRAR